MIMYKNVFTAQRRCIVLAMHPVVYGHARCLPLIALLGSGYRCGNDSSLTSTIPMSSFIGHLNLRASKRRRAPGVSIPGIPAKVHGSNDIGRDQKVKLPSLPGDDTHGWTDLKVPPEELRPAVSLTIGQCFNWRQATPDCWVGVLGSLVVAIRQTPSSTLFRLLNPGGVLGEDAGEGLGDPSADNTEARLAAKLRDYFFLGEPLAPLYERWSSGDPRMATVAKCIPGVRVVRQDPVECLFSFICSSNNNIARITLMLDKLRTTYGKPLLSVGKGGLAGMGIFKSEECERWAREPVELYTFPTAEALAACAKEDDLRALGFGYRAKFIVDTARLVVEKGGEEWALRLRTEDRDAVRDELVTLGGVGPKVADCVALFGLDQTSVIPVDVHVWRIACRDFDASLAERKSLTPTVYARVGELFRTRFGPHAGWAHSLLFAAELPHCKVLLPPDMQREMNEFRREERDKKATAKAKADKERERERSNRPSPKGKGKSKTRRKTAKPS